jgi:hypothetical protein
MKYIFLFSFSLYICCSHSTAGNLKERSIKQNNLPQDSIIYYAHNFKTDGLPLRTSPGIDAAITDTLNYNDSIAVISDAVGVYQLGDLKGAWAKVKRNNNIAYCYSIYLCRLQLPVKEEIGLLSLETYLEKYVGKKEVAYKSDSKPDLFEQKLFLKNFSIAKVFCFFYYLNFLDVNTPFPIFCIDYTMKTSSFTLLRVKSDGDSKKTINTLSLEYWYGNTETSYEFTNEKNGVAVKIVYNYGE